MIDASFFVSRRQRLVQSVQSEVIILTANALVQRSNDASFRFEQEANFGYLTGIDAPDWIVVVEKDRTWLIAPAVDDVHQIFDGSLSVVDAKNISGADKVLSYEAGKKKYLPICLKNINLSLHLVPIPVQNTIILN
jgi:hypothetical protein